MGLNRLQEDKQNIRLRLNDLQIRFGAASETGKKISTVLQGIESVRQEQIQELQKRVLELQGIEALDPATAMRALDGILGMLAVNAPDTPDIPGMEKMKDMTDRITTTMSALEKQFSTFGSGTLKVLEDMFGSNSFIGKIFANLKESSAAVLVSVQKALQEKNKLVSPDIAVEIAEELRSQFEDFRTDGMIFKDGTPIEMAAYIKIAMSNPVIKTVAEVTVQTFIDAREWMMNNKLKPRASGTAPAAAPALANVPAATPTATPEVAPEKLVAGSTKDMEVGHGSKDIVKIGREGDSLTLSSARKKATIPTIESSAISVIETKAGSDTETSKVIVTLATNKKISIDVATIRDAAAKNDAIVSVPATKIPGNESFSFEVGFTSLS